ncbi:hypothetical protein [Marivirga sp.]|uniref:hypothetical protein n=1 Tax=Marivirga sp. TaxID=2018662 RepID=UPI003DA7054D
MNFSKKSLLVILFVLALLSVTVILWKVSLSPLAIEGRENERNAKKIEIGFSKNELISIMGRPNKILTNLNSEISDTIYFYRPGFAAASGIDFYIENDTVVFIGLNE